MCVYYSDTTTDRCLSTGLGLSLGQPQPQYSSDSLQLIKFPLDRKSRVSPTTEYFYSSDGLDWIIANKLSGGTKQHGTRRQVTVEV